MEEALVARLTAVATPAGDRVSWFERVRGDALPALTLTKVSPGREYTHDGPDGLDGPRVQIDSWAATPEDAAGLSRAVLPVMEAGADVGGVRFHPAELVGETWLAEGEQDGGAPIYRVMQDFIFYHEEL